MPPKKKKPVVNAIVVGTVSTRSTRRQSIVNIEIPKLSKSKTTKEAGKEPTGSAQTNKAKTDLNAPKDLTEQIKETYNKMVTKVIDAKTRTVKSSIFKASSTNILVNKPSPKTPIGSEIKMQPPVAKTSKTLSDQGKTPLLKVEGRFTSNKALLQILEDWTDDDSLDDNRDTCEIESSKLKIKEEVIGNSSTDNNESSMYSLGTEIKSEFLLNKGHPSNLDNNQGEVKKESVIEKIGISIEADKSHTIDEKPLLKMEVEEMDSEMCDESHADNLEVGGNEEVIEYIIEENDEDIIIEEPVEETVAFEEDDYIVECVTEEIVSEENHLMDIAENNSVSIMCEDSQGEVPRNGTTISIKEIDKKCEEITVDKNGTEMAENVEVVRENVILEETSQSVSTSDSNDAEVRSYFTKEIENNETVKEEDIPNLDHKLIKERRGENREDTGSSTSGSEKNLIETEIITEVENSSMTSEESALASENISAEFRVEEKDEIKESREATQSTSVELAEIFIKPDTRFDENIYTKKDFGQEEILEIIGRGVDSKIFRRANIEQKMDTTEITNEESLESRVADLHLKDEDQKEEETNKEVADLASEQLKNEDSSMDEKIVIIVDTEKEEDSMEECAEMEVEIPPERPTTRRTRSTDLKSVTVQKEQVKESKPQKLTKPTKTPKEKKTSKLKELKTKEPRIDSKNKKKLPATPTSTTKKTKDKTDKKDTVKNDKKDAIKKTAKSDSEQTKKSTKNDIDSEDTEVRRSSRIKSISVLKKKTTGHGLVRSKSEPVLNESDISDSNSAQTESEKSTPSASPKVSVRERKTRWTRSSENLYSDSQSIVDPVFNKSDSQLPQITSMEIDEKPKLPSKDPVVEARLKQFVHLKENMYKTDRMTCKEAKKMTCDCFLTPEEIVANEYGCGEDCLNRLLLIECGNLCQVGDRCTNKRFQKTQFAPVEVFNTEKKGLGLRAAANIPYGEFILEYVGEVLNCEEFDKRAEVYSQDKNIHYYFMSLRADAIIDATMKGNISRFINHSCDPNAETQKWTVNGELRIGFFSTRTILAGEEITFDYRFQRYGKEAQKCYCEAAICRGWLGERPDEDSEDEDEEEEEEEETEGVAATVKIEATVPLAIESLKIEDEQKPLAAAGEDVKDVIKLEKEAEKVIPTTPVTVKRKSSRKKPRKDLFEDIDQLDEEIEMLVTTGLKNQAHTLKLSRLMVRAKEPAQRTKLLRILRRGELPCRRLFLDYHGLRLMHGYMIDAQHLVHTDKKYESVRLEMLQTLAVLPIPNKTMLQDSKVLPTVDKWASNKDLGSPLDSDSNSPKTEHEVLPPQEPTSKQTNRDPIEELKKDDTKPERSIEDQEEEIRFLATKLLEEWANLKEVFRIPKKERIEQMKEHEREANKKFMQSGYGGEHDNSRKTDRYRHLSRYKLERDGNRRNSKSGEKPSPEFIRLSKIERRKLFALQHELKEEERRMKQRELWRQHELNCLMIGTDPRFTAPFDPSRGYQCIWNPQIGQWQNYPLPPQNQSLFASQPPTPISNPIPNPIPNISLPSLPNLSLPPPQIQIAKNVPSFPYAPQMGIPTSLNGGIPQLSTSMGLVGQAPTPTPTSVPQMHVQQQISSLPTSCPQINSMQGIPGALPQNIPTHPQVPVSMPSTPVPVVQYQEPIKKEDDPSQVKFMGPIPSPVKLPPRWKCAKDKYGRPYYYHIKIRKSQWEPPPFVEPPEEPEESSESESSSDTSSVSSDTSSDNSDSDEELDDTKLLMEVRKQMEKSAKLTLKTVIPDHVKIEEISTPSPDDKNSEDIDMDIDEDIPLTNSFLDDEIERPPIDIRLKEQFNLLRDDKPPRKKRRLGLCEEILISPRTEEDRLQFKEDLKRYKANKERLKRQKELILQQTRKQLREVESKKLKERRLRTTVKSRIKEMPDFNSEAAKKIKENFRSNMASTVVSALNAYRKPDCREGKITNTEDFKHLARKLTHFVMLKEMKHIARIEDLTCTDNVKSKAREYIKKYMSKFGETYIKRNDSPDFKD